MDSTFSRTLLKRFAACLLVLLFCTVSWVGIEAQRVKDVASPERARRLDMPIPVRTEAVTLRTFQEVIGATALSSPSQSASIWVGRALGLRDYQVQVKEVRVREGQHVGEGETLLELDSELYIQAVKKQEAALLAGQAELEATEKLYREGAATVLQVNALRSSIELAQLGIKVAQRDLERCQIKSPIAGYVDRVAVVLGEILEARREVTKVHKIDPIHLRVDFPQERTGDVSVGQEADVVLDSFPQEVFKARVVAMSPNVNPETRVLPVILEMPNPQHRIKAGTSGFVQFAAAKTAMVVPAAAVIRQANRAMVFRIEEGKARIREIGIGRVVEVGFLEVTGGLAVGDEVVIHGTESLRDNDAVDTDWRKWSLRE